MILDSKQCYLSINLLIMSLNIKIKLCVAIYPRTYDQVFDLNIVTRNNIVWKLGAAIIYVIARFFL